MEPPGVKKYANENIFLNSINDLTRNAYSNNTKASNLNNKPVNRFDTDILLNSKESFESNNQKLNSLQDEILSLKRKLSMITEKDEEIQSLKCDIEKLNDQSKINSGLSSDVTKFKEENLQLRDNYDRLQLENMNNSRLQQENEMLKKEIINLHKQVKKEEIDMEEIMTEDYSKERSKEDYKETIPINIIELKAILSNRLKSYHEKHIDNLIDTYNLKNKNVIEKETMEKILLEAIHI